MHEPGGASRCIARRRKAIDESCLTGIGVRVAKRRKRETCGRPRKLCGERLAGSTQGLLAFRIAPLHYEVILRPVDGETIEVLLAHERANVVDVLRCESRCKLDHDAPARKIEIQRLLGIERTPVRRRRDGQHIRHRFRRARWRRAERCDRSKNQGVDLCHGPKPNARHDSRLARKLTVGG